MIFEERQIEKNNFSSRAILLFGLIILSLLVVLIKVFSLQVSGYSDYQIAALKNKNYAVPVQSLRGEIFDRNGKVLVKNEPTFDLITRPNLISNIDSFIEEIEPVIFLSQAEKTLEDQMFDESINMNTDVGAVEGLNNDEKSLVLTNPIEDEKIESNGLENFGIEEETPDLFEENSSLENLNNDTSDSKSIKENTEDEEDYEIPAFLRRQKN